MFKCLNNLFTHSFNVVLNREHHDYYTRSKDNVPKAFSVRNWGLCSCGSRGGAWEARPPPPPTYFSTKMRPKGRKHSFLETAPAPCLRVWMTGPLPTPRPYLEVCIRHLFGLRKFFSVKSLDQFKKTICNVTI